MSTTLPSMTASSGPDAESDRVLITRFLSTREEAAFAVLVERYQRMVYQVAWRVLRDQHAAEDALQATFLVLAGSAHRIRSLESVASWLHGTAFRVAHRLLKSQMRQKTCPLPADDLPDRAMTEPDWCRDPALLDEELMRLGESLRGPLILYYYEGRPVPEIARVLKLSPSAVEGRLKRGRVVLKKRLLKRGVLLSSAVTGVQAMTSSAGAAGAAVLQTTVTACVGAVTRKTIPPLVAATVHQLALREMTIMARIAIAKTVALCGGVAGVVGLASFGTLDGIGNGFGVPSVLLASDDGPAGKASPNALPASPVAIPDRNTPRAVVIPVAVPASGVTTELAGETARPAVVVTTPEGTLTADSLELAVSAPVAASEEGKVPGPNLIAEVKKPTAEGNGSAAEYSRRLEKSYQLQFENAPLKEVLELMSKESGVPIHLDDLGDAGEVPISIDTAQMDTSQALPQEFLFSPESESSVFFRGYYFNAKVSRKGQVTVSLNAFLIWTLYQVRMNTPEQSDFELKITDDGVHFVENKLPTLRLIKRAPEPPEIKDAPPKVSGVPSQPALIRSDASPQPVPGESAAVVNPFVLPASTGPGRAPTPSSLLPATLPGSTVLPQGGPMPAAVAMPGQAAAGVHENPAQTETVPPDSASQPVAKPVLSPEEIRERLNAKGYRFSFKRAPIRQVFELIEKESGVPIHWQELGFSPDYHVSYGPGTRVMFERPATLETLIRSLIGDREFHILDRKVFDIQYEDGGAHIKDVTPPELTIIGEPLPGDVPTDANQPVTSSTSLLPSPRPASPDLTSAPSNLLPSAPPESTTLPQQVTPLGPPVATEPVGPATVQTWDPQPNLKGTSSPKDPFEQATTPPVQRVEIGGKPLDRIQRNFEEDIVPLLEKTVTADFVGTPLSDLFEVLQKQTDIRFRLDEAALQDQAIPLDQKVTLVETDLPLRAMLALIKKTPALEDIEYLIENGGVTVTTADRLRGEYEIRIYNLQSVTNQEALEGLAKVITQTIDPEFWAETSGDSSTGSISVWNGTLVIRQNRLAHRQIRAVLESLVEVQSQATEAGKVIKPAPPQVGGSGFF